jgi:hypothetical protein
LAYPSLFLARKKTSFENWGDQIIYAKMWLVTSLPCFWNMFVVHCIGANFVISNF